MGKESNGENEAKKSFIVAKASFMAGIVVIVSIIKDVLSILLKLPYSFGIMTTFVVLVLFGLIVTSERLNKWFLCKDTEEIKVKRGVDGFGQFFTVMSVPVFALENIVVWWCLENKDNTDVGFDYWVNFGIFCVIGLAIIIGSIVLLFFDRKKK